MTSAALIINPLSRQGDGDLAPALAVLEARGMPVTVVEIDADDRWSRRLTELADGIDRVIVGGGDGTLNGALPKLLELGLPFGILPLGTANDLARTLGLPSQIDLAAGVIADGHTQSIDLGKVNGHHFLNVASIGISVEVAALLDRDLKARYGVLSYPISLWRAVAKRRAFRVRIACDSQHWQGRAIQLSIGNGRSYGGGMAIAEDAEINDGQLDLVIMEPQPVWRMLLSLPAFRRGQHARIGEVHHWRGKRIELWTRQPLPMNTDGEVTTETPARIEIMPKALQVFVPKAGDVANAA